MFSSCEKAERVERWKMRNEREIANLFETPNIPSIIIDNASEWGTKAPRETRPTMGHVVDDHEEDHSVDGGRGSLRAAM